jgi:hypothetical protein
VAFAVVVGPPLVVVVPTTVVVTPDTSISTREMEARAPS